MLSYDRPNSQTLPLGHGLIIKGEQVQWTPYEEKHLRGSTMHTILFVPEFVANTQYPLVLDLHFKEFMIPLLQDLYICRWLQE